MKIKYIVYPVVDGNVQLFINQRGYWSGYVLGELPTKLEVDTIGVLCVYEGESSVEKIYFCRTVSPIDANNLFSSVVPITEFRGPTWFPESKIPPGLSPLQVEVFEYVMQNKPFSGKLSFLDKTRKSIEHKQIEFQKPYI